MSHLLVGKGRTFVHWENDWRLPVLKGVLRRACIVGRFVRKAEAARCGALVVTADCPEAHPDIAVFRGAWFARCAFRHYALSELC